MKNIKPQIRKAFNSAMADMKEEIKNLRKERPNEPWFDWDSYTAGVDVWVVGASDLDSPEVRRMNRELGLTTNEGYNQWYNL